MKKKVVSVLLTAAMALSLIACGNSETGNSTENSKTVKEGATIEASANLTDPANINNTVEKDSITIGWKAATSLDPWGTRNDNPGNYEVYEMLFECNTAGERYAVLADESKGEFGGFDHEGGTGVYTVYIYDYIHDHAGNPVTASDVAWSYNYQYENKDTSGWDDFQGAEAIDDTTVKFTFSQEQTNLGALDNFLCRCFIVSEKAFKDSASELASDMCGTGPYVFDKYVSGSSLTLTKNDDYWQTDDSLRHQEQQANVRTITYQFITEGAQRSNGLATGTLDMVNDMNYENISDFITGGAYDDSFNVQTYAQKFVYYLNANCDSAAATSDENLRKAIYYAIDQDGLITALGGAYDRIYSYATSYYSDYDMVDWKSLDNYNTKTSVDAEKVQSYLDASGYKGETLILMVESSYADAGTIIAAQLTSFGINVELLQCDNATLNSTMADPTAWALTFGMMAGDYNVQCWTHDFAYANTADGTHTQGFVTDDAWNDLLNLCNTEDGHTSENMEAWWNMAVENAYTMGLFAGNSYNIVPSTCTYVCQGDKLVFLPGACCFSE